MIIPAQYDSLAIYKGDTFDLSLNWKDETGTLYDLRSFSATLRFFDRDSGLLLKELTTGGNGITLSNVEFNIVAKMTAVETAALDFGLSKKAAAHLELTSPDGTVRDRILEALTTLHD